MQNVKKCVRGAHHKIPDAIGTGAVELAARLQLEIDDGGIVGARLGARHERRESCHVI